jgi:hypothetical protein
MFPFRDSPRFWGHSFFNKIFRVRRISDAAFNIAISSQRQRTSSLTIASENVRRTDHHKLSQQSLNYFNLLAISLPSLSNCHLKS